MSRLRSRHLAVLVASVLPAACGGGGGGGNEPPPATSVSKPTSGSGDAQIGTVGQPLARPLQVVVTEDAQPSAGVAVTWSTTTVGGTMAPSSGPTNTDGVASSTWSLGTAAGPQTASATVAGAAGSPVTFTATAAAGPAATLVKAGGDGQSGDVNSQLPLPVQARVTDAFNNPVAGTNVNWSSPGAAVAVPTVASDASGLSQVTVTLGGAEGSITIVAAADGLVGSPLTFTATAVIPTPAPTSLSLTVGNNFIQSDRNMSQGPAVDTLAVGGTVTWTWVPTAITHDISSAGPPSFPGSATQPAPANHVFTFNTAGTYRYYCSVHAGPTSTAGMVGRIVVK